MQLVSDTDKSKYKTLLDIVKKPEVQPSTEEEKAWRRQDLKYTFSCPYVEDFICKWSKKFRKKGPFFCYGSWHQTCSIFMRMQASGEDPTVLIQ